MVGGLGFLRELAIEKPQYLLLGALILLWGVESWIFSVSSWIPILVAVVATIQYANHQIQIAVDDLSRKLKRAIREALPTTPIENREWLNKLLIHFWPNCFNPMLSTILSTLVENSLKHRRPKLLGKIELQEFSLGTSPPSLALEGARWSKIDSQEMMHLGFEWDTSDMSILLAAKLGYGTVRININHLFIKGELQLIPTLDGRAILYSFLTVPEVSIGVAFGSGGSQSLPATELPGVSWLVKLLSRPLLKTMVEPQRHCFILPVHMRKKRQESPAANGNKYLSFEYKSGADSLRNGSSSDHESPPSAREDEDDAQNLLRRKTIGNGPPEAVFDDWTREINLDLSYHNANNQAFSREHWRLLQCQNGLRIFEELSDVDYLPRSCSRTMKAEGIVDATCEEIFELVMSMDGTRFEWDCTFQQGSLVEEVDGHTAILNHRLRLDWFPMFVWPRDLCYVRYWRRNDDGSYVVLFCSREHDYCARQTGFVRAHLEGGGFIISPMKSLDGRPRTQVQHVMQIDLKGWGVGYLPSFQQHCLLQMLNCVAGLREYFAPTDERTATPRIPLMVDMKYVSVTSRKGHKRQESSMISGYLDDYSDEDEDFQIAEPEEEVCL